MIIFMASLPVFACSNAFCTSDKLYLCVISCFTLIFFVEIISSASLVSISLSSKPIESKANLNGLLKEGIVALKIFTITPPPNRESEFDGLCFVDEGEIFDGSEAKDFKLVLGKGAAIPGFEKAVTDMLELIK
jgi:hypothetical protein